MTLDTLLTQPSGYDPRDIASQCCICKDWVNKDGEYIKLSEEHNKEAYVKYVVSHGYCEPCMKVMLE